MTLIWPLLPVENESCLYVYEQPISCVHAESCMRHRIMYTFYGLFRVRALIQILYTETKSSFIKFLKLFSCKWSCDYDEFALMILTFCVIHMYSRSTLCPEVTVHGPFIKPSRKSSLPGLSVLSEKPTTRDCANKKIHLVVTYHPSLPPIRQSISANHHILHTSDRYNPWGA